MSWKKVVRLDDGRTFVSDGALALDAELAKTDVASLNSLSEAPAKVVQQYLTAQLPNEFALSQLTRSGNSYVSATGVRLNPLYLDYLRRALPESGLRLRMKSDSEPVIILYDGKPVGLIMPMRQ